MKRYSKTYLAVFSIVLLFGMLTACQNDESNYSRSSFVNVGDEMPAFTLTGTDGETLTSASLSGQVYLLNFFDTGCKDCQKEFPILQQVYENYKGRVIVVNVPRSQALSEVEAYWKEHELTMPYYKANDSQLYYKFASSGIPRTYIVDRLGKVQALFTDSPVAAYEDIDNQLKGLVGEDTEGTISLKIKVSTRSNGDQYYFQNEHVISKLDVFFFDVQDEKLLQKVTINNLVKAEDEKGQDYDITYIINSLRIKIGRVNIFAIANYYHLPDSITDQATFLDMVDSLSYSDGIVSSVPVEGAVMTNRATSLLNVDLVKYNNKVYVLNIDLERVMAKVRLGIDQNTFPLSYGTKTYANIHITNYKFVNLNTRYYLFQHKDHETTLGKKPVFLMPENYEDYNEGTDEYIVDPYFYDKANSTAAVNSFANRYKAWFGNFTTDDFASMPAAGNFAYAYILENTAFKECQKNGYLPGIVFKAAVSPITVLIYDTKTKQLVSEDRPEYWPSRLYLFRQKFYGSIQAINVDSSTKLDELKTYTDSQLKQYGIKQCVYNQGVYETYYTYWIQHRTNFADMMGPMKYGIVRNNFYNLLVTGVSGLGNSVVTPEVLRDNYPNSFSDIFIN